MSAQCSILNFGLFEREAVSSLISKPLLSLGLSSPVDGYNLTSKVVLPGSEEVEGSYFCLPDFKLEVSVPGISGHLTNLDQAEVPLSYSVPCYQADSLVIRGMLGNDLTQHFQVFELNESAGYMVLRLTDGFVPIGSIPKVKCPFKNKEKLSANTKCKSKTSKCVTSSIPTCNKFKPLTDFCSTPLTAHPPTNCKQYNTKSEKVGFKQF